MTKILDKNQVRELVFQEMRAKYYRENEYAKAFADKIAKNDWQDIPSDHTAIRVNGQEAFVQLAKFMRALGMEAYEGDNAKGYIDAVEKAITTGDDSNLEDIKHPYQFDSKGLQSTHFDVAGEVLNKGSKEKLFISILNKNLYPEDVHDLIDEDRKIFSNKMGKIGNELIIKLEKLGELTKEDAGKLSTIFLEEFSKRMIPMKQSTFDTLCNCKMAIETGADTELLPTIGAIGAANSGLRNHQTPIYDRSDEIAFLPPLLEKIGVPPGTPPVQFNDGLAQTSSKGVPQNLELLDDSTGEKTAKINDIVFSDDSYEDKRSQLIENNLITLRKVSHEYVEFIKRAELVVASLKDEELLAMGVPDDMLAKAQEDGVQIPVWERDGKVYSALEVHRDKDGFSKGDYGENGFLSYNTEVEVKQKLYDEKGNPALTPGFRRDNATNIFLGTSLS